MAGVRHVQAVLLFFGLMLAYGMRVTIITAVMVINDENLESSLNWSPLDKKMALSSFFWGYIILPIPGGILATKIGGSPLITISITINSVTSLLMPYCASNWGWKAVCLLRILQGLSQGFILPSVYNLLGKWAPVGERSRLGAFVLSGSQFGYVVQHLMSRFLVPKTGWVSIFYVNGFCGAVWVVFFILMGSDSPQKCKMISDKEKLYIQTSLEQLGEQKKLSTPWRDIFTSLPFISLIIVHCAQNWCLWTLLTEIPFYMMQVLGVDIINTGVQLVLPYLAMFLLSFFFGFISDLLPNRGWLSVTATRKLSNSIGLYGPAVALIGITYIPPEDETVVVGVMALVVGLNAGHITGLMLVHLDLSPNFAGNLIAITNSFGNIIFIIAPLVTNFASDEKVDPRNWKHAFCLASTVCIVGNTLYLILGTSKLQKWNYPGPETDCRNINTNTDEKRSN